VAIISIQLQFKTFEGVNKTRYHPVMLEYLAKARSSLRYLKDTVLNAAG